MRSNRGFTLIEVLVAVALMAMISTILIASLTFGGHAWRRVTRLATNTDEVAQAQDLLRDRLGSMVFALSAGSDDPDSGFLSSDGASLEFNGVGAQSGAGGVVHCELYLSPAGSLVFKSRAIGSDGALTGAASPESLLTSVESIVFQFWVQPPDAPGRWLTRWTDRTASPSLIRMDVNFLAKDVRRWPPLYVELHVDTPANCPFDVVSRRCRSQS